jgi:hypothetical protein
MPSYVFVRSLGRIGETIDAMLCDPSVARFPDRRTNVPVRVRLISEQVLSVDDDPPRDHLEHGPTAKTLPTYFFWLDEGGGTPQNRLNKIRSGGGRGSR